jgi:hypothetical protein
MTGILNALIAGVSGAVKDTYFNLVTLLLPGNGTNGAQNNTFLDSSTNNFTITRNGDTTQGTFSPFSQTGWSNRFDGSANYRLTIPDSTDLDLTGDFCLEMWVYVTANSSSGQLVCIGNENAGQNGFIFYLPGGTTTVSLYTNGGAPLTTSSGAIALNTWHHLALVRSGAGAGNTVIYVDGVSKGSAQITTSFTGIAANGLCIGQTYNGSFVGVSNTYISNVRLVKGSPVYTGAFTPPTSPLTAITNTVLLTCQSNRFVDTNTQTTAKTITVTGSPSVTPFSPFAPTSSYSAAAVGGSGYFDGSGDYLSVADNAAFTMGTGDFTVEYWVYWNGTGSTFRAYGQVDSGGSSASISIRGGTDASNKVINGAFSGTTDYLCTSTASLVANTWNHIAFVRDGTTLRQYINGGQDGTASISTASVNDSSSQFAIGRAGEFNGNYFGGYISSFRLLKGTCLYPSGTAFTPPTAPLTNITNTSLLLNFTNAGVVDATAKNVLETEGNAQISTAQSKWGGGSMLFNGTTDYLKPPPSPFYAFGTGDFTIECWVRFSSTTVSNGQGICQIDTAYLNSTLSGPAIGTGDPSGKWGFFIGTTAYEATSLIPSINTWYHVAMVRYSGTTKLYVDGTAVPGLSQADTNNYTKQYLTIGGWFGTGNLLDGYIDDFRVSRFARYTANFTAPTAPFPVQ